jgi:hypothetical protein
MLDNSALHIVNCEQMDAQTSSQRFIPTDPNELIVGKYSKKTHAATMYSQRLLQHFLTSHGLELQKMDKSSLSSKLCDFYASLRRENGDELTAASLVNIRYGLCRYVKNLLNIDIIKDTEFTKANNVFVGKLSQLKRDGKSYTLHFNVISSEDMKKIGEMNVNTPHELQLKTWFIIQYHFALRGGENLHKMLKSDLILIMSKSGTKEIHLRDFLTKNHREGDRTKSTNAFIAEVGGTNCPIKIVSDYLEKLNVANTFLWQKPNKDFLKTGLWYSNAKVGVNMVKKMMRKICEVCHLEGNYTNHCVRATAITILGKTFEDTDVQAVSGHKSLNALGIYKRTSNEKLSKMSAHLHQSLHEKSTHKTEKTCTPSSSHNNCCLSFGHQEQSDKQFEDHNELAAVSENEDNASQDSNCTVAARMNIQQEISSIPIKKGNKIIILNNCKGVFHF